MMKKRIFILIKWMLLFAYLIASMGFVNKSNKRVLCSKFFVTIDKKHKFVNEDIVNSTLLSNGIIIDSACYINDVDLKAIETVLEKNMSIKKSEAYACFNGELFISIEQRNPIMRVITKENINFYVDDNCCYMPLSSNFTSNVLVISGNISFVNLFSKQDSLENNFIPKKDLLNLYDLVNYISKDELWINLIEQIYVNSDNEYELVPRVGNNIIVLGGLDNYQYKLWKLKALYSKGVSLVDLDSYSFINLKYSDKVICKKR